jgi:hypothetical protein
MTIFSIFERDPASADPAPAAIPDRFSWLAAILPPVYLMWHGLWLAFFGWLIVTLGLAVAARWVGPDAASWIYVAFAILTGFEASSLRRARLFQHGWRHSGERIALAADLAQVEWLKRNRADG